MSAQKGKDLLLKMDSVTGLVTVAGLRARTLSFNTQSVDVTHSESAGRWRELLEGAGVKRAAISGSGVFKDAQSDALVRQAFFAGALVSMQIIIPDFGMVRGPFQITALDIGAEHDREVTFDLTLESAGELLFEVL